ncbi:DUF6710 family protein [Paenibacillus ferrarius]|uniref:DUF6710 family protein n=1 Tax=Paenibacillus ferrarius TaxID=1469647 RepID=UPI003D2B1CAD
MVQVNVMFFNFSSSGKAKKESRVFTNGRYETQKMQFTRMINMAESVLKDSDNHVISKGYRHPIFTFLKLLGLKLQTNYLTNLLYDDDHGAIKKFPDITPWLVFFDLSIKITPEGKKLYDFLYKKEVESQFEVDLAEDLILPWPWNVDRCITTISSIGNLRPWGVWNQDSNHRIYMILPFGICFVVGGNHSIAAGILSGKGKLNTRNVYDVSSIYDYVYTDGAHYKRIFNDSIIAEVGDIEFAVIFEIGRKMVERGITYGA